MTVVPIKGSAAHETVAETPAERARRLQAETERAAADSVHFYVASVIAAQLQAQDIADGGPAYPPGVRDLTRRFAKACEEHAQTLQAIVARAK